MTVLEAIQKSADFLDKKKVESARLQAELLLAHVLKLPRMKLYLNFDRGLSEPETAALRELVRRRGLREPLQHLVGSTSFCGYEIHVNRAVLIPRPETELLAECGWEFLLARRPPVSGNELRERAGDGPPEPAALDFGSGSGCLAIALAAKHPAARITAVELSAAALAVARENAARNGVAGRIDFIQGERLAAVEAGKTFDLIISNPPYVPTAEIATLEPEVRDFDPRAALDGGADGLDFYRALAVQARPRLRAEGKVMLEFGDGQAAAIQKIFEDEKWIVEAVKEDYSQRARIIIIRR